MSYIRYCDHFVLLSEDRDELLVWRRQIERFLHAELALALNPRDRLAGGPMQMGV